MARETTVLIEKDDHGFYAWYPELKGCQSQGNTLEEAMADIKEAAELSQDAARRRAERAGFDLLRLKGGHRIQVNASSESPSRFTAQRSSRRRHCSCAL